ncbi:MAG: hypothetical protein ACE5HP_01040 [Gemmatimonadota bacterium]
MRTAHLIPTLACLAGLALPATLRAQDQEEAPPETRVLTVTTFQLPSGEDGQKVMQFIDRVVAPQARNNPNILSYRIAQHYWGSNSAEVKIIAEYANWAAVEAPCGTPCQEWAEANTPEEGTPEREEFDDLAQAWQRAFFQGHSDEIYSVNMSRAK